MSSDCYMIRAIKWVTSKSLASQTAAADKNRIFEVYLKKKKKLILNK